MEKGNIGNMLNKELLIRISRWFGIRPKEKADLDVVLTHPSR
jgi:hypothetical protein